MKKLKLRGKRLSAVKRLFKAHRVLGVVAIVAIVSGIGGGAYAALGGSARQPTSGDIELQRGLVGQWKMDGNAKDSSPYRGNGNLLGSPAPSLTTDREGRANSAYSFSGTSSYIGLPSLNSRFLTANNTPFSISLNIKPSVVNPSFCHAIADYGTYTSTGFRLCINSGGKVGFWTTQSGGTLNLAGSTTLVAGNWYNIVIAYDGTTARLYLNGVVDGSASGTVIAGPSSMNLGLIGGPYYFSGVMDDVRLYNRTVSAVEANALAGSYDASLKVASGEKGLLGQWHFQGNAKDDSPNRINASVTTATLTADRKGIANNAYSFNGTTSYITTPINTKLNITKGTVSAWIKTPNPGTGYRGIVVKQGAYGMFLNNNVLTLYDWIAATGRSTAVSLNDDVWHHVAFTFQSGITNGTKVYIDGVLVLTTNFTVQGNGTGVAFGAGGTTGTQLFAGIIDEPRIYDRELTAVEVKAQYESSDGAVEISDLQKGLIGYWPLNGNAKDATAFRNNGTLVNSPALIADRKGRANSAYNFVLASSQYINLTGAPSVTNGDFTVSAWAKITSGGGTPIMFSQNLVGTWPNNLFIIYYGDSANGNGIRIWWNAGILTNTVAVNDGVWRHVTVTRSGSTLTLYKNGVSVASATAAANFTSTNTYIGAANSNGSMTQFYNGSVSDLRMYKRALSAAES